MSVKRMTRSEWEATPADYKTERDNGSRAVLELVPGEGTCLVPVEVIEPVTLRIVGGPSRTADDDGWQHNAYTVALELEGRTAQFPWRQGLGIEEPPTAAGVLECLFGDAAGVNNARGFEDWAGDYGYDTDSRKAEATYNAVRLQTAKLAGLFGVAAGEMAPWQDDYVDIEELAARYAGEEQGS